MEILKDRSTKKKSSSRQLKKMNVLDFQLSFSGIH